MKLWIVAAAGAAAAGLALYLGRKKPAAADPGPDHIEPPPDRPPYKDLPTKLNPVGAYPGVQHLHLETQNQLPNPQTGPTVGSAPFYVDRAPGSVSEASALLGSVGGQFPLHLFAGTTALVKDTNPSNPFAKKNVKKILLNGVWFDWSEGGGQGLGPIAGAQVLFWTEPDGTWKRLTPSGEVAGFSWLN